MSGGAGHIADMIARMKQNRELQKYARDKYKRLKGQYENDKRKRVKVAEPDMSESELIQYRKELRARLKAQRKRSHRIVLLAVIIGLVGIALLYLAAAYLILNYPH